MTTIFLENLKTLVVEQLTTRIAALQAQTTQFDFRIFSFNIKLSGFIHEIPLSKKQANALGRLIRSIYEFKGTGNDFADKDSIKAIIAEVKHNVEDLRDQYKKHDDGKTIKCLEDLGNAIENAYSKLDKEFTFPLLGIELLRTPEHVAYSHACHYLIHPKFEPDPNSSIDIRRAKEEAMLKRLIALKKALHSDYTLAQQKETVKLSLEDLDSDNNKIIKPLHGVSLPVTIGLSIPIKARTASPGNMAEEIEIALEEIAAMTEENSDCPKAEVEHVATM